jgi:hypothetical protein
MTKHAPELNLTMEKGQRYNLSGKQIEVELKAYICQHENIGAFMAFDVTKESDNAIYVKGHGLWRSPVFCIRCRQDLTDPASRILGYGETCAEKMGRWHPGISKGAEREALKRQDEVKNGYQDIKYEGWLPKSQVAGYRIVGETAPAPKLETGKFDFRSWMTGQGFKNINPDLSPETAKVANHAGWVFETWSGEVGGVVVATLYAIHESAAAAVMYDLCKTSTGMVTGLRYRLWLNGKYVKDKDYNYEVDKRFEVFDRAIKYAETALGVERDTASQATAPPVSAGPVPKVQPSPAEPPKVVREIDEGLVIVDLTPSPSPTCGSKRPPKKGAAR